MKRWRVAAIAAVVIGSHIGWASAADDVLGDVLKYGSVGAASVAAKLTADELQRQRNGQRQGMPGPADPRGGAPRQIQSGPVSITVSTGSGDLGPMTKSVFGFFKSLSDSIGDASSSGDDVDGQILERSGSNSALLRRNLDKEIRASGNSQFPEDPEDCAAHHIVPAKENRKTMKQFADKARSAIADCVEMDSAENGVYLPNKKEGSNDCKGSYHPTLHTADYYEDLASRLTHAKNSGINSGANDNGCAMVRSELRRIKNDLIQGKL